MHEHDSEEDNIKAGLSNTSAAAPRLQRVLYPRQLAPVWMVKEAWLEQPSLATRQNMPPHVLCGPRTTWKRSQECTNSLSWCCLFSTGVDCCLTRPCIRTRQPTGSSSLGLHAYPACHCSRSRERAFYEHKVRKTGHLRNIIHFILDSIHTLQDRTCSLSSLKHIESVISYVTSKTTLSLQGMNEN